MKLLNLDFLQRRWLNQKNALDFDKNLNEKFAGLTHEESNFFLEMSEAAFYRPQSKSIDEINRFLKLYECHERTLIFHRGARKP